MGKDMGERMSVRRMPMMTVIFTLLLKLFLFLLLVNSKPKEKDSDSYQSIKYNPYHLISNTMKNCHINDVCTSTKSPQVSIVCERMLQTLDNVLRTLLHGDPPQNIATAQKFVDEAALPIVMHAMRAGIHTTLGSSPGSLVFNRDMFLNLNIPLIANWHTITHKREHLIHENFLRENQKRIGYDYAPQQCVLKKRWKPHN